MIQGSDVTVVIPTIEGREELLHRAVASVQAQQVPVHSIQVQLDVDRRGAHWARNAAIEKVTTDWIAFLDDDDEFLPNHIRTLVRGANKSRADLVFSYAEFVDGRDPLACVHHGKLVAEPINVPWTDEQAYWIRIKGNFIPVTYLVRTEAVRAVGGFPAPYTFSAMNSRDCEDYGLILRLLDAGYKFHHCTGVRTWRYHFHDDGNGVTNTGGRGADRMHELDG
jgi:glycosyltransferase involved in cell wall biosynthesis